MIAQRIARWRVPSGFAFAALVLWLAAPTGTSLLIGGAIALVGESLRVWAAGHVEKSREVTSSGPYGWFRHPLYVGSSIIGLGAAVASHSVAVFVIVGAYLAITIGAAIRAEEAHLREKFGGAYDAYASGRSAATPRAFSLKRAIANREHHSALGLALAFALLAMKWGG